MGLTPPIEAARRCVAVLKAERDGSRRKRVGVRIDGSLIGYMPDYLSAPFLAWLKSWNLVRAQFYCLAVIETDEKGNDQGRGGYRVKLDIEIPFKMTTMPPQP